MTFTRGVVGEYDVQVEVGAFGGHPPSCGAGQDQAEQPISVVAVVALGQINDQPPLPGGEIIRQLEIHGRALPSSVPHCRRDHLCANGFWGMEWIVPAAPVPSIRRIAKCPSCHGP